MSKYYPLRRWLSRQHRPEVTVRLGEIQKIIASPLPRSARERAAWWANDNPDKTRHVQCLAWMLEGWRAYPRLATGRVIFRKAPH
jgi:hypothetical protein